jgi:hypothetical protein
MASVTRKVIGFGAAASALSLYCMEEGEASTPEKASTVRREKPLFFCFLLFFFCLLVP